jgi:hypothetical protein
MSTIEKCNQLANKIRQILNNGITLDGDVVHYIDSTFSNPTVEELQAILHDESNCEKDSLIDLLFFPDSNMQLELEEMLENFQLEKQDETCVLEALGQETQPVCIRLPEGKGAFNLKLPHEVAPGFIARLHISKHLDSRLRETIDKHTDPDAAPGHYPMTIRFSFCAICSKNSSLSATILISVWTLCYHSWVS